MIGHPFASLRALLVPVRAAFGPAAVARARRAYLEDPDAWADHADWIAPLWREAGAPVEEVTAP